jgi:hypothetical protein
MSACFLPLPRLRRKAMAVIGFRHFRAALIGLAAVALPASGFAQSSWINPAVERSRYADDDRPFSYNDARRVAYDQGYREGLKEGEKDGRRGDRFEYQDEREFRNGDRGYHRNYGDRERYRQSFRSGYAAGYSAAYRRVADYGRYNGRDNTRYGRNGSYGDPRYGRYGGSGYGYSHPALHHGGRDGYEKGQEDARKNRSFDPLRHSWYRSGDRHYEREYGSRDQYKDIYRRGFQQGYERGYQEGRYRW